MDSILLFLDFEKGFDSVEYNFMFKILKRFNFGEQLRYSALMNFNMDIFKIDNFWSKQ